MKRTVENELRNDRLDRFIVLDFTFSILIGIVLALIGFVGYAYL